MPRSAGTGTNQATRLYPSMLARYLPLLIGFPAVANSHNIDAPLLIENRINNSIITDADAPHVFLTGQFASTVWSWEDGEGLDLGKDTANDRWVEGFQLVAR